MDYKKIIKSRNVRMAILRFFSFVPDKQMLQLQYRIKTGRKLNLKNPQRFTEKLQWYKLYHKDPLMIQCVDKYDVRAYVESKGLGHILNECYGVFDRVEDIDFDALPDQFVLKDTLGGGGNSVILVKDKNTMDQEAVKAQLRKWVNEDHRIRSGGREWPYYSGKKHRIIVEKLLINETNPEAGVNDYKIMSYAGKPEYIVVDVDRYIGHKRNFYDVNWNRIEAGSDCPAADDQISAPSGLAGMLETVHTLSEGFPYVRVDLYNVEGRIYFGEMTFFPWSGYVQYEPDAFDFILGEKFRIDE